MPKKNTIYLIIWKQLNFFVIEYLFNKSRYTPIKAYFFFLYYIVVSKLGTDVLLTISQFYCVRQVMILA